MADKVELTTAGSHRATSRGHAPGGLVESGETVPPGIPVGSWMEPNEPDEGDGLDKLTNAKLREIVAAEGIEVESDDNKADLVAKIRAGRG